MTATLFKKSLKHILELEGIYSDNKKDRGGKTKFGITEKTAQAYGWQESIELLPLYMAEKIYYSRYWQKARLSEVAEYSPAIAHEIFEAGVNCGIKRSSRWLQKALNSLRTMDDLEEDGIIGKKTLKALSYRRHYLDHVTILKMLNAYQAMHYILLCKNDSSQKEFIRGWFKRINYT